MSDSLFQIGNTVRIVDDLNGHSRHICNAIVERLTPTQIEVRNEYGDVSKFQRVSKRIVGYVWPYRTRVLRFV